MKIVIIFLKWIRHQNYNSFNLKAFKSLSAYLKEEIKLEKEQQVHKKLPVIAGFESKTEGPNVTLSKTYQDEQ